VRGPEQAVSTGQRASTASWFPDPSVLPSRRLCAIMVGKSAVEVERPMVAGGEFKLFAFCGAIEGTYLRLPCG
jgi:hypothetical protein